MQGRKFVWKTALFCITAVSRGYDAVTHLRANAPLGSLSFGRKPTVAFPDLVREMVEAELAAIDEGRENAG